MKKAENNMVREWEKRAKENAYHWVVSDKTDWKKDEYFQKGREHIQKYVFPFFAEKEISKDQYASFKVLDIGCGTGRLSRALSEITKNVIGVDVSETMIRQAKEDNADKENIDFMQTSGEDLWQIDDDTIDFVFSLIVFQHIPSQKIIEKYFEEIKRVLKPGRYAKVQVRGTPGNPPGKVLWFRGLEPCYVALCLWRNWLPIPWLRRYNTVYGACFTSSQLRSMLKRSNFEEFDVFYEPGNLQHLWAEVKN